MSVHDKTRLPATGRDILLPEHVQAISEALGKLTHGVIQLTVHNGRLMQLDVTERRRFAD